MASVNVQEEVAAPAKKVWDLISDFGGIQKFADPQKALLSLIAEKRNQLTASG